MSNVRDRRDDASPVRSGRGRAKNRAKSFECVHAAINEEHMEEFEARDATSRTSLGSAGTSNPKKVRAGGPSEPGGEPKKNRSSRGSGLNRVRSKQFKEDRVRHRNMDGRPDGLATLMHKQASFSEVDNVTVVVPWTKQQQRIEALDALEKALGRPTKGAFSSPDKRHRSGVERKDLLFSSSDFWEELRASVRARKEGDEAGNHPAKAALGGCSERKATRTGGPTHVQLQAERARIQRAREALPLLIQEVKDFQCAEGLGAQQALARVTRLLDKIDVACETAFPTTHATGRMLSSPEGCQAYKYSCGKTRGYGHGGWGGGVGSCGVFEPELTGGSLEDKSTFVSRVEALRCWRNAATLSLQILSHFGKQGTGADVCKSPLLHSSPCTHVTHKVRALMDALLPAMLAVHGLAHADGLELAALALAERRQADLGPPSSSPGWLSRSSHVAAFISSGAGKYLEKMREMKLPPLSCSHYPPSSFECGAADGEASGGCSAGAVADKTEDLLRDVLQMSLSQDVDGVWVRSWANSRAADLNLRAADLGLGGETRGDSACGAPLECLVQLAIDTLNDVLKGRMRHAEIARHLPWTVSARKGHDMEGEVGKVSENSHRAARAVEQDFADWLALLQLTSDVRDFLSPFVASLPGVAPGDRELDSEVLSDLAELCLVHGRWAHAVATLRRNGGNPAEEWHTCISAPDLDEVQLLLRQVRSLFRRVSGKCGLAVQEELLAWRTCRLQGCLANAAVDLLSHARTAWDATRESKGEQSKGPTESQGLWHAVATCERAVSSCKQLLKMLELSIEFRCHKLTLLLETLRKQGYVRLLPRTALSAARAEPAQAATLTLVFASWSLLQKGDDEAEQRVSRMLSQSFTADASEPSDKLHGHIFRIFIPRRVCDGCEGLGVAKIAEKVDFLWKDLVPIYVDGLQEEQDSWWGRAWCVAGSGDGGSGLHEAHSTTSDEALAPDGLPLTCVLTVTRSGNLEMETTIFENYFHDSQTCTKYGKHPQANTLCLRKAAGDVRVWMKALEHQAEGLLRSLGCFWGLRDLAELEDTQLRPAVLQGERLRFSRQQLDGVRRALRPQARFMSEQQWSFWVGVYKALAHQRPLAASQQQVPGFDEIEANLMEQVWDLILSSSSCASSPAPCWDLARLWLTSRLCCAPLDHVAQAASSPASRVTRLNKFDAAVVGGGARFVQIGNQTHSCLEVATWHIKTKFTGSLSRHVDVQDGEGWTAGIQSGGHQHQNSFEAPATGSKECDAPHARRRLTEIPSRRRQRDEALLRLDAALAMRLSLLFELRGAQRESRHCQRAASDPQLHRESSGNDGEEARQWYKQQELGKGAFASVFRGFWWKKSGGVEFIAIKELSGNQPRHEGARKMAHEAAVMSRLMHINIVRYYGHSESVKPHILMEYCPDGTLRGMAQACALAHGLPCHVRILEECAVVQRVFRTGKSRIVPVHGLGGGGWQRYAQSTVCMYLLQILQGLRHMHANNMIHRDLKTDNILLADHARCVKLSDLGETHAAAQGEFPNVAHTAAFTPGHAPPEFFWLGSGETIPSADSEWGHLAVKARDQAAYADRMDVWALGGIAVELATGHKPQDYLFESRGQPLHRMDPRGMVKVMQSNLMARQCPEKLRLDYREHPVIQSLAERDKWVAFLDSCFEVEPSQRASAEELLKTSLMQDAKKVVIWPLE